MTLVFMTTAIVALSLGLAVLVWKNVGLFRQRARLYDLKDRHPHTLEEANIATEAECRQFGQEISRLSPTRDQLEFAKSYFAGTGTIVKPERLAELFVGEDSPYQVSLVSINSFKLEPLLFLDAVTNWCEMHLGNPDAKLRIWSTRRHAKEESQAVRVFAKMLCQQLGLDHRVENILEFVNASDTLNSPIDFTVWTHEGEAERFSGFLLRDNVWEILGDECVSRLGANLVAFRKLSTELPPLQVRVPGGPNLRISYRDVSLTKATALELAKWD